MDGRRGWWVEFGGFLSPAITSGTLFFSIAVMIGNTQQDTGGLVSVIRAERRPPDGSGARNAVIASRAPVDSASGSRTG